MCARAFRAAQNRAEVLRVADLIADDDKRRLALLLRCAQNIGDRAVVLHGCNGHHALMRLCRAQRVQLAAVSFHHHDPLRARFGRDMSQRAIRFAFGKINLVNAASGAQRLYHCVAPFDQIFSFGFKRHTVAPSLHRSVPMHISHKNQSDSLSAVSARTDFRAANPLHPAVPTAGQRPCGQSVHKPPSAHKSGGAVRAAL